MKTIGVFRPILFISLLVMFFPEAARAWQSGRLPGERHPIRHVIGGSKTEMAYHLLSERSGSFLVTGFSESWTDDERDAFILRVDADGRELRRTRYGDARSNIGFVLREHGDGYVMAGWSTDSEERPLIVRIDREGRQLAAHDISTPASARATDLRMLPGGDYLLAGQMADSRDSLEAMVWRTDSTGKVRWQAMLGGPGTDRGFAIDVNEAGEVILVGLTTSPPALAQDVLVAKLDLNGNLLWRKVLGGAGYQTGHSVIWGRNGTALVTGYGIIDPARGNDAFLYMISSDGTILSRLSWGDAGDDRLMSIIPFQDSGDSGFIAVGYTTSFGASGWDAHVVRLDASGGVVWQGTLGGAGDQTAYSAALIGRCLLIVGHEEVSTDRKRDILLFTTDLNGNGLTMHRPN